MDRREGLRRARLLSLVSVGIGGSAAVVAVVLGIASRSLSMIGFGLDAAIDSAASIVLVWRFTIEAGDPHGGMRAERIAERLIGIVLVAAAVALVLGAARTLLLHDVSEASAAQVALLVASLAVLPPLAWAKRRLADQLRSNALRKDALLTAAAAVLALVALVAGQVGPTIGLWWADAVGSIAIAAVLGREGWFILRPSNGASSPGGSDSQ
jgi:divalent metal cation (Fe/Co/Zn/Cd) transporter